MEHLSKWIQNIDGDMWLTDHEDGNFNVGYRIKEIIYEEQSPFQHVMVLDTYDFGHVLALDGIVQTTSRDGFIYNEMIAHIPMMTHPNPKDVLIIGGGDCGVAVEVTKYPSVQRIDMVEIDELVVTACKKHLPEISKNLSDPRVNFIYDDGTKFIKEKLNTYDVIIVDSSDPIGPAVELFSQTFYQNIYNALKEDGLMTCQSQSPFFHLEITKQTNKRLKSLFPIVNTYTAIVPTYPGGFWSFTLGSKQFEPIHLSQRWDKEARYVNADILEGCFKLPEMLRKELE